MAAVAGRVVHVVTWLDPGGAQETAAELCTGLNGLGWDAILIGGKTAGTESPAVTEARSRGVAVEDVSWLGRAIAPWSDLVALVRLVSRFRSLRPAVVHTHSSKAGLLGRVAAFLARVPVRVHTVHGWSFDQDLDGRARKVAVRLERIVASVTDMLVVVTPVDRARGLRESIGDRSRYRVIRSAIPLEMYGPGADEERAAIKQSWGLDATGLVIGTVTRFAPPKDFPTLLRAFALVSDTRPDATLVVAGDGPERASVEALIGELGLRDRVLLLGHRDDVPAVMRGFDLFAFSSRREAMPRVVVEALASGLPVVASDVGGVREIVDCCPAAIVVPQGEVHSFATAIEELADSPRAVSPARRVALGEFDVTVMVAATDGLYRSLSDG